MLEEASADISTFQALGEFFQCDIMFGDHFDIFPNDPNQVKF